jgi:hypothetical protein
MNNYVSPVIFDNDELAEGVYASGSGSGDCWTMTFDESQREKSNPSEKYAIYRIDATHHVEDVLHISKSTTMWVNYTGNGITGIQVEGVNAAVGTTTLGSNGEWGFEITCTSTGAIIKRVYHGNAYNSGDNFNIMIRINDADGESVMTGLSWTCEKVENVQETAGPAGELGK